MDLPEIVSNFLFFLGQNKDGIDAFLKVGTAVTSAGTTVVKVIQKGKHLVTYMTGKKKNKEGNNQAASALAAYSGPEPIAEKKDVAVVVDIARRSLRDVEKYLVEHKIDANLIVVTNDPLYGSQTKMLDENKPDDWEEMIKEFNTAINAIKHAVGAVNIHIFMSVPLPVAFGMGAVWGTVDRARIYHWNSEVYKPVLNISRNLRFQELA
jgi:hypothetical protein